MKAHWFLLLAACGSSKDVAILKPEIQLLQYIRAAGLPEPVPQFRVWLSPTHWVDLDFAWPWLKIFIEFDSYKFHGNRDKYMRDVRRRLELEDYGWRFVVVTDDELDSGCALAMRVARQKLESAAAVSSLVRR